MQRRKFLQTSMYSVFFSSVIPKLFGHKSIQLDQYGGWKDKKFRATGFFRVEKDKRWWLVSPEGNAFLSFGINHFHSGWWKAPYNKDKWMELLGVETEDEMNPALRNWLLETCKTYGFNTVGVHTDLPILNVPQPKIPYIQTIPFIDISHWKNTIKDENFIDLFATSFYQHCDELAKKIALPLKNDPYLLGYAMADCPLFTEEDCRIRPDNIYGARRAARIGWPRRLRNFGPSSAGKQAYVQLMSYLYEGKIEKFNTTYATAFTSFENLEQTPKWRLETDLSNANETRDTIAFLKLCVQQYYKTAKAAILRYDPNHLFFGDKLNGNTDTVDTVLPVISKYTDVLFYQMYGKYEVQQPSLDRWSKSVDIHL